MTAAEDTVTYDMVNQDSCSKLIKAEPVIKEDLSQGVYADYSQMEELMGAAELKRGSMCGGVAEEAAGPLV